MPRPVLAFSLTVLIVIATLGGLGFVCAAPHTTKSQHPQGDWRILDPVVYENIAIFPVVSGSSQDSSSFLTLEEGLASGEVIVSERGTVRMVRNRDGVHTIPDYSASASVNQLVLINRSKRPLLLLAGELVSGGKQDRVIGKNRIVPVGAPPLPLDVFCVEHGRKNHRPSQRPRKSRSRSEAGRGLGCGSRRHYSESGPRCSATANFNPEYSRCYRRQRPHRSLRKNLRVPGRRRFHR